MKKTIKTGLAAFGSSGKLFHAPFLEKHPGFELSAIVERHKNDSRSLYPQSKLYRSFDELINDAEIELIVVNTPVQTHFEYAEKALLKGKNVIVEKPFTVNARQAEMLNELAEKQKVSLIIYQNRRWDGDFLKVREIIETGQLGTVKEADIQFYRYRTEISPKSHKEDPIEGAGILHDLGAHIIDQAVQLFGFPQRIFADLGKFRKGTQANDYFEIILFYNNELRVRLRASMIAREHSVGYIIHGENGSFTQNRMDSQEPELLAGTLPDIHHWASEITTSNGLLTTEISTKTIAQNGNYMAFYEAVFQHLINNKPNPVPATQAVQTMRIIDAAQQSYAEQRVIPNVCALG
ncbi:MAG: Gfo/Idh/MocA family oxidoreductase [Capnocytophaga sp.]|nr:Gfo/Idh/MocA family oxidoreductase [Capnocytophaga sp.]MDO5609051.1 Gfo/Idh/MocA family oxidoreductase [Capnocytophaga sp.]